MRLFANGLGALVPVVVALGATLQRFRYGADYAISQCTDVFTTNNAQMEYLSLKHSIRSTVFEGRSSSAVLRDVYTQNIFESSIYWTAWGVCDNGTPTTMPDVSSTLYGPTGVAFFDGVSDGEAKLFGYPSKGSALHYRTGGRLGVKLDRAYNDWDKGIGVSDGLGSDPTNTSSLSIAADGYEGDGFSCEYSTFKNTSAQSHRTASFGYGWEGSWQLMARYFIAVRNSVSSINSLGEWLDSWDVVDRTEVSYPSTQRITDDAGTDQENIDLFAQDLVAKTIPSNGWYRNFTHWHSASMATMINYYAEIQTVVETESEVCWFAGMGEATEYKWFRDMITGITTYIYGQKIIVEVQISNVYTLTLDDFITPVSIEVDLTGTPLEGLDVEADRGRVKSLGSDKYLVEVFADRLEVVILSTVTPDYIDLSKPSVDTESFVTDTLTITTDKLTVATLYSDVLGTLIERKLSNATEHVFTGLSGGSTYYLGLMTRENKSIIHVVNT